VDLERYLRHAAESESALEPRELELGFGIEEGDERGEPSRLPAFELAGGVRLRGRIDRVDVSGDGRAVVYDYKGSRALPSARWIKDGNLQLALYMRAVEKLLGLPVAGGFYQPLSGEDLRARGVLDGDSGIAIDGVANDVLGHTEVRSLLEEAVVKAREAAGEAGRGELQARPETCAFRGGCMYPTICRCER
jgi:RecB family exonuclease